MDGFGISAVILAPKSLLCARKTAGTRGQVHFCVAQSARVRKNSISPVRFNRSSEPPSLAFGAGTGQVKIERMDKGMLSSLSPHEDRNGEIVAVSAFGG
jgi:hypothetical protein